MSQSRFLTPIWVITIVFCGLAVYIVLRHSDKVTGLHVGSDGAELKLGTGVAAASDPDKLNELANDVKNGRALPSIAPHEQLDSDEWQQIERIAPTLPDPPGSASAADFSGVWQDVNGALYQIAPLVDGTLTFTETSNLYGVPMQTAVGQGQINGKRFEFGFNSIVGVPGVGVLQPGRTPNTLVGTASFPATGARVPLNLRR